MIKLTLSLSAHFRRHDRKEIVRRILQNLIRPKHMIQDISLKSNDSFQRKESIARTLINSSLTTDFTASNSPESHFIYRLVLNPKESFDLGCSFLNQPKWSTIFAVFSCRFGSNLMGWFRICKKNLKIHDFSLTKTG